ncbi:hypothetical protein [Derxia gummosa]|uniref:Uncharacterized protein n=1 Tax=Derxia gummosa DSM 723 TaxID=1121388 RepID=A0A8B6X696_9BURK|nr:hypothetical protein [Derxia gummosa]
MTFHPVRLAAATALALGLHGMAVADPVPLSASGERVLARCNPDNLAHEDRCRLDATPEQLGFTLVASRSTPIIKNEVTIGTLHDRVWRLGPAYVFGTRVQLNAEPWDLSGLAFNLNDLARQVLPDEPVVIAYRQDRPAARKALIAAGRTFLGLNEYEGRQPGRDNGWVDFRIDVNAAEPEGTSSPSSPWLYVLTRAPAGHAVKPFAFRLLSSDVEDPETERTELYLPGYQPN